ncbi:MAG: hypothetical protein AAGH92_07915 [Planctomycetota bacterium]
MRAEDEFAGQILIAMEKSKYKWRTAHGIARELDRPKRQVEDFLLSSKYVVRARTNDKRGRPLYTTRKSYLETTSLGRRILDTLTNRVN